MSRITKFARLSVSLGIAAAFALSVSAPAFADNVTGSTSVSGGNLTMSAANSITFLDGASAVALNGTNKTATGTVALDVNDATGTGTGWNLQVSATRFTDSGTSKTLPADAASITSVANPVCATNTPCTAPTNDRSLGVITTTPTKFFNAAVDTGMGDFTITPTITVRVPANTYAGSYSSTITVSIVSGP